MKTIKNLTADELRKSILQLAIQGKLVKQDPNDEPASELVKKIYEEKKKLITEGKIKKDKNESYIFKGDDNCYYEKIGNNEPIKIEDLPFDIPDNWMWIRLKNISELLGGYAFKSEMFCSSGIRVIRISDFDENGIKSNDIKRYPYSIELSRYKIHFNDILMCMTGGTVGKCTLVKTISEDSYINQRIALIRIKNINVDYFYFLMLSSYISNIINKNKTSTNDNISMGLIENFFLPLPPLNEQQRIVDKINSFEPLLQEYETLEKKLTQLELTFPEELKKSILQLAIQGKLVKQDPNDESASELIKKIYEEKRKLIDEGKIKKDKNESYIFKGADKNYYEKIGNNEPIKIEDLPFDIPHNWIWIHIENIVNSISSKQYQIKETEVEHVGKYKVISQSKEYSIGYSNIESKVYKHKEPVIVFGDHTAIVKFIEFDFIVGADGLKIFEPVIKYIDVEYLYHVLLYNADGLDQIGGYSRHYKYLKEKLIPLPPLKEQQRIVDKIISLEQLL